MICKNPCHKFTAAARSLLMSPGLTSSSGGCHCLARPSLSSLYSVGLRRRADAHALADAAGGAGPKGDAAVAGSDAEAAAELGGAGAAAADAAAAPPSLGLQRQFSDSASSLRVHVVQGTGKQKPQDLGLGSGSGHESGQAIPVPGRSGLRRGGASPASAPETRLLGESPALRSGGGAASLSGAAASGGVLAAWGEEAHGRGADVEEGAGLLAGSRGREEARAGPLAPRRSLSIDSLSEHGRRGAREAGAASRRGVLGFTWTAPGKAHATEASPATGARFGGAAAPLARTASGQVRRRPACWQRPLPVTTVAYNGKGKERSRVLCYLWVGGQGPDPVPAAARAGAPAPGARLARVDEAAGGRRRGRGHVLRLPLRAGRHRRAAHHPDVRAAARAAGARAPSTQSPS